MNKKLAPLALFFAFQRVDDEARTVEGYCFVNEDVGDGVVWSRSAMEAATPDYLKWSNLREMHQLSAVGVSDGVEWDANGAFLRAKVVDDAAWAKVKAGVYKGFSARIKPKMMRGNVVTSCDWIEVSLVDRPADPDCPIAMFRTEDVQAEYEVEAEETPAPEPEPAPAPTPDPEPPSDTPPAPEEARGAFADRFPTVAASALRYRAFDLLSDLLWTIQEATGIDPTMRESQAREVIQEFADVVAPIIATGQLPSAAERAENCGFARVESSTYEDLQRAATEATARISGLEADLSEARAENARLLAQPTTAPPVRFPQAFERTFQQIGEDHSRAKAIQDELAELTEQLQDEPDGTKRTAGVTKMNLLKSQLAATGAA